MKFRTIFILFNVVILVSFCFVFLFPFFVLGGESSLAFWKSNWYLALFFLALLGALNAFFLLNRKVFTLVEREDWAALSAHLADQMLVKGRYRPSYIRLYVNACLLRSDVDGIDRLEEALGSGKPALLRANALVFGVTRLLRNRPAEAEAFLARYLGARDVESRDWLRFDYAFSLVLQKRAQEALPFLQEGTASRDAVLALLAAYLLGSLGPLSSSTPEEKAELASLAEATRTRLASRFSPVRWSKEVERAKGEVHIVILSKLVDEAGRWLFAASASPETASAKTGSSGNESKK